MLENAGKTSNKTRVLKIYDILLKHSDMDHKLSKKQICDYLSTEFDISVVQNTIDSDLKDIVDAEVSICVEKTAKNGKNVYYYCDPVFDKAEIRMLADAVNSSRFITKNLSSALLEKLVKQVPDNVAEWIKDSIGEGSSVKTENRQVEYIIDRIIDAILLQKRIRFTYTDYAPDKTRINMHNGQSYTLSPFYLHWNGEFYYLIGYDHGDDKRKTFRIDRIKAEPEILQEDASELDEDIDMTRYSQKAFRMLESDMPPTKVQLICDNSMMRYVIDQFGLSVETEIIDEDHFFAKVEVYPSNTFLRWVFGWNGKIVIQSPDEVIERYKALIQNALDSMKR